MTQHSSTHTLRNSSFALLLPLMAVGLYITAIPAKAADAYRYSLASQQEYGRKLGFKLAFEGNSPQIPRKLDTLGLVLSIADGKSWRFPTYKTNWQWDREYKVKAVINSKEGDLWVDDQLVLKSEGGFTPSNSLSELKTGLDTRNMDGTTEYRVMQTSLRVSTDKGQTIKGEFPNPDKWALPIFLFEPQVPLNLPWKMANDETVTIETTFRLVHGDPQTMAALAPFVDRFGQSRHADWPGKVHNEAEFKRAADEEKRRNAAYGMPKGFDRFGGSTNAGWSEKPTGFFRTTKRNGYWWLISPEGNPCFYLGVDTVLGTFESTPVAGRESYFQDLPPRQGEFAKAWGADGKTFGFTTANLIRKFKGDYETASWKLAEERLRTWGFSGLGKWSGVTSPETGPTGMSIQPVLRRGGVPTIGRMPDIFDENVRATFRATLDKTIAPNRNNPYILGWSVGNEHDEIVFPTDIKAMLQKDGKVPAKRALVAYALDKIYNGDAAKMAVAWKVNGDATVENLEATAPQASAADIETLRQYFADNYYGYIYRTVKELDPNHLYFGFWMGIGWWENDSDWRISTKYTDVVGYDEYRYDFKREKYGYLIKETDKPMMLGEFSYPAWYNGQRGYGTYGTFTSDDAASGKYYAQWVQDAARDPHTIGMHWFQYRDQPISGRNNNDTFALAKGEHYAFGLVDITDRPKWDMIDAMRKANLSAVAVRMDATKN